MYIYVYVIGLVHSKGEYTICKRNGRWKWLWVYAKKGSLSNNRTLLRYIFPTSQRVELAFADLTNTQRRDGINATTDNIYTTRNNTAKNYSEKSGMNGVGAVL